MRALVTGACGFVGGHLVSYLQEVGDQVFGTVLPGAAAQPPCESFEVDICNRAACREIIARVQPEVVYHLAGLSFVPDAEQDFDRTLLINVGGTFNMARACHECGEKKPGEKTRFIYISSGEVYGSVDSELLPVSEQLAAAPTNNYSLSKLMGEETVLREQRRGVISAVIVRPFNHIGPGQNVRFVAASFAKQLALIALGKGEPILYVGNLDSERDFSDVRDIVRGYYLAAQHGEGIINLGSGRPVPVRAILTTLIRCAEARTPGLRIQVAPDAARMRKSENPLVYADCTRAQTLLGWEPRYDLEQTLADLFEEWIEKMSRAEAINTTT